MNMDLNLSGKLAGRRRWCTMAGAGLALALVLGVPAAAYAVGSKTLGFHISNDDFIVGVRVPTSKSNDIRLPATTSGIFVSDVHGCPSGLAAYSAALRETTPHLPDKYVALRRGRDYCALKLVVPGLDWGGGDYHFEVSPFYLPQPAGGGFVTARW